MSNSYLLYTTKYEGSLQFVKSRVYRKITKVKLGMIWELKYIIMNHDEVVINILITFDYFFLVMGTLKKRLPSKLIFNFFISN